jgi:hypothetical protein
METFSLHGFDVGQATLSGADQELLRGFVRELKRMLGHYPKSFVTIIGPARRADAVASFLIASEAPADKLRTITNEASRTVEVKLFKRNLSYKPGAALIAHPPEIAARPAAPPFAMLPGKFPGEMDDYRARTKEDTTIAALIAGLHREKTDLPKGTRTPSEAFGKGAQAIAEALGLPDWAVEKARAYGVELPAIGLQTVLEHLDADKSLDDRERAALRKLVTALPRITE